MRLKWEGYMAAVWLQVYSLVKKKPVNHIFTQSNNEINNQGEYGYEHIEASTKASKN